MTRPTFGLGQLRRLLRIGSTPIYNVTLGDDRFFRDHPLTEKIQAVPRGHEVLQAVVDWLGEQPAETVWSLTVDLDKSIVTTLHPTEHDVFADLRKNYDPEDEHVSLSNADMVQALIDQQGLVIYISNHHLGDLK